MLFFLFTWRQIRANEGWAGTLHFHGCLHRLPVIITMWCVRRRGPLSALGFNPLILVLVAIAESLLLNEKLHLRRYVSKLMGTLVKVFEGQHQSGARLSAINFTI
ncbi:hypothetical protein RJ639_036045 [Escallonia herrerae]|uniref:Uncharacterized protein n=1 Tax=Escallonia herrerae TaxID=1293975 RepID=A0AA89BGY1_9ASTE|nr:hypothetical protein RJ639_036045 [Escallonia herrerae]